MPRRRTWSDIINSFQSGLQSLAMRTIITLATFAAFIVAVIAFIAFWREMAKIPQEWRGDAFNAAGLAAVTVFLACIAVWLFRRR